MMEIIIRHTTEDTIRSAKQYWLMHARIAKVCRRKNINISGDNLPLFIFFCRMNRHNAYLALTCFGFKLSILYAHQRTNESELQRVNEMNKIIYFK